MGQVRLINVLKTTEKILCIHRNYSSLSKIWKMLTLLRIAFVIVLYFVVSLGFLDFCTFIQNTFVCGIYSVHSALTAAATLVALINGIAYSDSFEVFSIKMDKVHVYFKDNVSYKKSMMYLLMLFLMIAAFYMTVYLLGCFVVITKALYQVVGIEMYLFSWNIIEFSISYWRELRFTAEFYIFIIFVRVMVICLYAIKIKLQTISKRFEDITDGVGEITFFELRRDLHKWASAYNCIATCCDDLKKFYGIQILLSLSIFMFYFVLLSYNWCQALASNIPARLAAAQYVLFIVAYFLILVVVLLYNAQKAQNEADSLKKLMSILHCKSLQIPGVLGRGLSQIVKDTRRCMEMRTVRVYVTSTMPLQMPMLLVIVSTAISYTIILLQFNHVL